MIDFLLYGLDDINVISERYTTLLSIPYCYRTIYDIFQYRDTPKSELFDNRTQFYVDFVYNLLNNIIGSWFS